MTTPMSSGASPINPHAGPNRTVEPPIAPSGPKSRLLQHPVPPGEGKYERIYLWQLPLRLMHWLAALSVVVLIGTGFWIGRPFFLGSAQSTSTFGTQYARLFHFLAGMTLAVTGIVRLYWLFAGNRFERFPALFPVRGRDLRNLFIRLRYYLFVPPKKVPSYIGHNPMAQLSYTLTYLTALVMVLTGFALYTTSSPNGWMYGVFYPVTTLLGGLQYVRVTHHVASWIFLIFIPVHIYLALRADISESGSGISQMINGGKFVAIDEDFEDAER